MIEKPDRCVLWLAGVACLTPLGVTLAAVLAWVVL